MREHHGLLETQTRGPQGAARWLRRDEGEGTAPTPCPLVLLWLSVGEIAPVLFVRTQLGTPWEGGLGGPSRSGGLWVDRAEERGVPQKK